MKFIVRVAHPDARKGVAGVAEAELSGRRSARQHSPRPYQGVPPVRDVTGLDTERPAGR